MYVEPVQERGLLAAGLPDDTWDDESRRDAVWLAAADLWLRLKLGAGESVDQLAPTTGDIRVAGIAFGCAIITGCRPPRPADVFLFSGDELKWQSEFGTGWGSPVQYRVLAGRIAEASVRRWQIDADVDGYSRLQALLWSVQALRLRKEADGAPVPDVASVRSGVHAIIDALGFGKGPASPGAGVVGGL
jgi:hypothetical protein